MRSRTLSDTPWILLHLRPSFRWLSASGCRSVVVDQWLSVSGVGRPKFGTAAVRANPALLSNRREPTPRQAFCDILTTIHRSCEFLTPTRPLSPAATVIEGALSFSPGAAASDVVSASSARWQRAGTLTLAGAATFFELCCYPSVHIEGLLSSQPLIGILATS